MQFAVNQGQLEAFLLVAVRFTAFLVTAPPFSYRAIPARIKAMLAVGLALAAAPRASAGYTSMDTAGFIGALVLELLTGALLGFLVFIIFAAVQSAGSLLDLFSGFQMAQAFDPQSMVNGAQFTRLFQMAALALMFASDAYQVILLGLARSFTALPLGGAIDLARPAEALVTGVTVMFVASVQIAGPLLVVLFLADAGLGLLTRVAPALNAFAMGFPLKILITLLLAGTIFIGLPRIVASLTNEAAKALLGAG